MNAHLFREIGCISLAKREPSRIVCFCDLRRGYRVCPPAHRRKLCQREAPSPLPAGQCIGPKTLLGVRNVGFLVRKSSEAPRSPADRRKRRRREAPEPFPSVGRLLGEAAPCPCSLSLSTHIKPCRTADITRHLRGAVASFKREGTIPATGGNSCGEKRCRVDSRHRK